MAVLFLSGFESGDLLEESSSSGTVSAQSTVKRTGTYALKVNPTTSATGSVQLLSSVGTTTPYLRFYFRADTLPSSGDEPICSITLSSYSLEVRVSLGGILSVYESTVNLASGTTPLTLSTWYRIELSFSEATSTYNLYIDGVLELTGTTGAAQVPSSINLGKYANRNGNSVVFYYDDVMIRDDQLPGQGQIECLLPSGAGSFAQWINPANSTTGTYLQINQIPQDGSTSDINGGSASNVSTFAFTDPVGSINTVNCVKWWCVCENFGSGTVAARFVSGASHSDSSFFTPTASWAGKSLYYATNPNTSVAWTSSDITGLEAGVVAGTSIGSYVTTLALMVDYTISVHNTYNESGSGGALSGGQQSNTEVINSLIPSGGVLVGGSMSPNNNFDETASGGIKCGGASLSGYIAANGTCGCNNYTFIGKGGAKCGGAISQPTGGTPKVGGGAICNGKCYVTISNLLWDEFEACWDLQETGGPYIDQTGNGNVGTGGDGIDSTTVPAIDVGIRCSSSQSLTGRQWITLPNGELGQLSPMTVNCWIKIESDFMARTIYSRGAETSWSLWFGYTFLRQLTIHVQLMINNVATEYKCVGKTWLERDRWYMVSAVYDPGNMLAVYIDGRLDNSVSIPYAVLATPSGGCEIGAFGAGSWMIGNIEYASVQNVARSSAELTADFAARCDPGFFVFGGVSNPMG